MVIAAISITQEIYKRDVLETGMLDTKPTQRVVGSLVYAVTGTRPDTDFAKNSIAAKNSLH